MVRFELVPKGPFSLAASAAFLEGFAPAAHRAGEAGHLHLAFVADGGEAAAGVCLRQPDADVAAEVFGDADPAAVQAQVARILSLDVDGGGFPEVGRRDRWSAGSRLAGQGCGRSVSSHPTRRPPGR